MRRIVADWLPLPVLFGSYQLAGWIGRKMGRPPADALLLGWDRWLFGTDPGVWLVQHLPPAALGLLDLFYFSYYILVPLAPWLMYMRHGRRALWQFWVAGGTGYLLCYLLMPWFPSTPPRLLFPAFAYGGGPQAANLWILNRFSIHGNVFPSAHVAAAVSFALCHRRFNRKLGWFFLVWAAGITVSTVSGGYHYGVDAVGGVAAGALAERITSSFSSSLSAASSRQSKE